MDYGRDWHQATSLMVFILVHLSMDESKQNNPMTNQSVQVNEGLELSEKLSVQGMVKKKMAGKFMTVDGPVTQKCSLLIGQLQPVKLSH